MSQSAILRVHAESTKERISKSIIKEKNPFFGKTHTAETLAKIALSKSLGSVYLYNEYKELTCIFSSITLFSKLIQSNNQSIKKFIDSQPRAQSARGIGERGHSPRQARDLFRGNWYITNNLIKDSDFPIIQDHSTDEYKNLIQTIIECKNIRKASAAQRPVPGGASPLPAIYVFDPDSILLAKYDGVMEAQKAKAGEARLCKGPLRGPPLSIFLMIQLKIIVKQVKYITTGLFLVIIILI